MHRYLPLLAVLLLLASCGRPQTPSSPAPADPSAPPTIAEDEMPAGFLPASFISGDENRPRVEWGEAGRSDALLRNFFFSYLGVAQRGDMAAAKADFLTEDGFARAMANCTREGTEEERFRLCVTPPPGTVVVMDTEITGDLHASIRFISYDDEGREVAPPRTMPVVLTGKGPRAEDGTLR